MPQIILTQPHTHAGVAYASGKRLEVDKAVADWLVEQGIARLKSSSAPPTDSNTDNTASKDSQS